MAESFQFDGLQFAVIGDPINHSLSPAMHNAAFQALGMNARYIAVHVIKEDLAAFTENAKKYLAGFNITVPHKNNILPFLSDIAEHAALAESVNTVTVKDGSLIGTSTDGYGFEQAVLETGGPELAGTDLCFLGCGGVVPALAFHAAFAGVRSIRIINRTVEKAQILCEKLQQRFPDLYCAYGDSSKTAELLDGVGLIAQCTSLGLKETDPAPIDPVLIPQSAFLFDTIYKKTKLLAYAEEHHIPHANGASMLLHQGAKSFEIWTGRKPPLDVMRNALAQK